MTRDVTPHPEPAFPLTAVVAPLLRRDLLPALYPLLEQRTSSWAVLLVHFKDDDQANLPERTLFEELCTGRGSGNLNLVDYFFEMSHHQLDLSSSEVFGWFDLGENRSIYAGNVATPPAGQVNRDGLVALARQRAEAEGVDFSRFAGVLVCFSENTDTFGYTGGMTAVTDAWSRNGTVMAHEMAHGYGANHARLSGSDADYQDPWDIMSAAAYPHMHAPHARFGSVGPGISACSMRALGWLDESRVWRSNSASLNETIVLRPLHRHDLPGLLAADVGGYLIEFRMNERFDAAISRPGVLVHTSQGGHSYLMPARGGSLDLGVGDVFEHGNKDIPFVSYLHLEVLAIDPKARMATIHLTARPAARLEVPELVPADLFGGVAVDGGGFIVVGGKPIPVPPWGQARVLLEQVARYLELLDIAGSPAARSALQQECLNHVVRTALALHQQANPITETPPGYPS